MTKTTSVKFTSQVISFTLLISKSEIYLPLSDVLIVMSTLTRKGGKGLKGCDGFLTQHDHVIIMVWLDTKLGTYSGNCFRSNVSLVCLLCTTYSGGFRCGATVFSVLLFFLVELDCEKPVFVS